MTRDMELIRLLLIRRERDEDPPGLQDYPVEAQLYNLELMHDAGLIVADFVKDGCGKTQIADIDRLTWAGHDFLDSTRDSEIWKKAKEHIIKPGVSWTFQILVEWLKREAQQRFLGGQTSSCDISSPRAV